MAWFGICLLHSADFTENTDEPILEESWHLLQCDSEEMALTAGSDLGYSLAESFINPNGNLVHWQFKGIKKIKSIDLNDSVISLCYYGVANEGNILKAAALTANVKQH